VDVPEDVASAGGSVTVLYRRLRRTEDGRSVAQADEIHDLRVPPGTRDGETLRVPRMGHASLGVGGTGELVATVRLVKGSPTGRMRMPARETPRPEPRATDAHAPPVEPPPRAEAPPRAPDEVVTVEVGVAEALLGGHVEVPVADGRVTVVVPPCSSSGLRLRVRGRGRDGGDVVAELRIVVPRSLDAESRALIERFAALNPRR
jgi:DnaJ-class molecular chaperone